MTTLFFKKSKDRFILSAIDHASGSKEACAGVSAITSALLSWLNNYPQLAKTIKADLVPGYAFFEFEGGAEAAVAFFYSYIGLVQIAMSYPESVTVKESDIDSYG